MAPPPGRRRRQHAAGMQRLVCGLDARGETVLLRADDASSRGDQAPFGLLSAGGEEKAKDASRCLLPLGLAQGTGIAAEALATPARMGRRRPQAEGIADAQPRGARFGKGV